MKSSKIRTQDNEFREIHGLLESENSDYRTFDISFFKSEKYPLPGRRWKENQIKSLDVYNPIAKNADLENKYDFSTIPNSLINYFSDTIFQIWKILEHQQDLIDTINDPDTYAEVDRLNWILFNMWIRLQGGLNECLWNQKN